MQISLNTIDWGAISAISTILLAVFGYLINRRLRTANETAEKFALLSEFRKEIIEFSTSFFELTSLAITHCNFTESVANPECEKTAAALSALADTGRFLFPNYVDESGFGSEKGPAFEGFRREPLDAVLAAYHATMALVDSGLQDRNLLRCRELLALAGQPRSRDFDESSVQSHIIEARRSYLNSVVPSTFPRDWHTQFASLYGPIDTTKHQQH